MKAIVLEIRNNEAAILSDEGVVSQIKNKNYKLGQVVTMKKDKKINSKLITKIASVAAVFTIATVSGFAYTTPTSYVSLDVNPSIEYTLNTFNRVISVTAVNEDGEKIVVDLDVENKDITEAVQKTVDKLIEGGYITDDENAGVIIATSNSDEDKAEKLATELEEETQDYLIENGETAKVEAEAVGKTRVDEARVLGVTPGKLNLVQKLVASSENSDVEIVVEDWLDKSVKEINKAIKANREALKNDVAIETIEINDEAINNEETENSDDNKIETADDEDQNVNKTIKERNIVQDENKSIKEDKVKVENTDDLDDEGIYNDENDQDDEEDDVKSNNLKLVNNKK